MNKTDAAIMDHFIYRHADTADIPELKNLWLTVWPEDSDYAKCFFTSCFSPGDAYVAEADGKVRSMFFSLKGYTFHAGSRDHTASYLYALATDPAYRGIGLGRNLTEYSASEDHRQGCELVFLNPASDSLRNWYHDAVNAKDCFMRRKIELTSDIKKNGEGVLREISPEIYYSLRTQLLEGTCHMDIPLSALRLQADFCRMSGGGLWSINIDDKTGICLGDIDDGHLILRELLCPGMDPLAAAGIVIGGLCCESATVYTPAFWHTDIGTIEPACVLIPGEGNSFPEDVLCPFWGFMMD